MFIKTKALANDTIGVVLSFKIPILLNPVNFSDDERFWNSLVIFWKYKEKSLANR